MTLVYQLPCLINMHSNKKVTRYKRRSSFSELQGVGSQTIPSSLKLSFPRSTNILVSIKDNYMGDCLSRVRVRIKAHAHARTHTQTHSFC